MEEIATPVRASSRGVFGSVAALKVDGMPKLESTGKPAMERWTARFLLFATQRNFVSVLTTEGPAKGVVDPSIGDQADSMALRYIVAALVDFEAESFCSVVMRQSTAWEAWKRIWMFYGKKRNTDAYTQYMNLEFVVNGPDADIAAHAAVFMELVFQLGSRPSNTELRKQFCRSLSGVSPQLALDQEGRVLESTIDDSNPDANLEDFLTWVSDKVFPHVEAWIECHFKEKRSKGETVLSATLPSSSGAVPTVDNPQLAQMTQMLAMFSQMAQGGGRAGQNRAAGHCHNCDKPGHLQFACPEPKAFCDHPACAEKGRSHLSKFCFFKNPALIDKMRPGEKKDFWKAEVKRKAAPEVGQTAMSADDMYKVLQQFGLKDLDQLGLAYDADLPVEGLSAVYRGLAPTSSPECLSTVYHGLALASSPDVPKEAHLETHRERRVIVDTGASVFLSGETDIWDVGSLRELLVPIDIRSANAVFKATHVGKVSPRIPTEDGAGAYEGFGTLIGLYSPSLHKGFTLLSVRQLTKKTGIRAMFGEEVEFFDSDGKAIQLDSRFTKSLAAEKTYVVSMQFPRSRAASTGGALAKFASKSELAIAVKQLVDPGALSAAQLALFKRLSGLIRSIQPQVEASAPCKRHKPGLDVALADYLRGASVDDINSLPYLQSDTGKALLDALTVDITVSEGPPQSSIANMLWHRRLGHPSFNSMKLLEGSDTIGFDLKKVVKPDSLCEDCQKGKAVRAHFPDAKKAVDGVTVHGDLAGPLIPAFGSGVTYICAYKATPSALIWVSGIKNKSDQPSEFTRFGIDVGLASRDFTRFVSDNGGEYVSDYFSSVIRDHGAIKTTAQAHEPQSNGDAESIFRWLFPRIITVLSHPGLPKEHYEAAAQQVVRIYLRVQRRYRLNGDNGQKGVETIDSPYRMWFGRSADLTSLRVFGCVCYLTLPKATRPANGKLNDRGVIAVYMGQCRYKRAYLVWIPGRKTYDSARSVRFDETRFYKDIEPYYKMADAVNVGMMPPPLQALRPVVVARPIAPVAPIVARLAEPAQTAEPPEGDLSDLPAPEGVDPVDEEADSDPPIANEAAPEVPRATVHVPASRPRTRSSSAAVAANHMVCDFDCLTAYSEFSLDERSFDAADSTTGVHPASIFSETEVASPLIPICVRAAEFACTADLEEFGIGATELACAARSKDAMVDGQLQSLSIPRSIQQAVKMKENGQPGFYDAAMLEMKSLEDPEDPTYVLMPRSEVPDGEVVIPIHMIFDVKTDANLEIEKYKGRAVADSSRSGSDVPAYANTLSWPALRLAFDIAGKRRDRCYSADYITAFLNSRLPPDHPAVYARQVRGAEKFGPNGEELVCKMLKALYGLKTAARLWEQNVVKLLLSNGWIRCVTEPCLFFKNTNGRQALLALYVDDVFIFIQNEVWAKQELDLLGDVSKGGYPLKYNGELRWALKVSVYRLIDGTFLLNQATFIHGLHRKYCNGVQSPKSLPYSKLITKLGKLDPKCKEVLECREEYQAIIGACHFLANVTRPDICFTVSTLGQYGEYAGKKHLSMSHDLLQYLNASADLSIRLGGSGTSGSDEISTILRRNDLELRQDDINTLSDAATAERQMGGHINYRDISPIAWHGAGLRFTCISICDAEHAEAVRAVGSAIWIAGICKDLGMRPDRVPKLLCDNTAVLFLSQGNKSSKNSRHMLRRIQYLREMVEQMKIRIEHIPSACNIADIFTKPLDNKQFYALRKFILSPLPVQVLFASLVPQ